MPSTNQGRTISPFALADILRRVSFRRRSHGIAVVCALATMAALAQSPAPKAKSVNELKAFFQQNCIRCHGLDGSARSPDGKKLGGLDFTQATQDFQTLSGPASEREIRTMIRTIRKGIFFGLTMPAWKDQLSHEDATLMVREILLKAAAGKTIEPEVEAGKAP
jgi:mono/diheme cytochrome c family protein